MSYHPYRVRSIEDETRLLEQMISLQNRIRVSKENQRRVKSSQNSAYTRMFQPVTDSLKKLQPTKPPVKVEVSTSTPGPDDVEKEDDGKHESSDDAAEEPVVKNFAEEFDENEGPGDLFRRVLQSIPERSRDDGVFGLDVKKHRIGDYNFVVNGNDLYVFDPDSNDPNDSVTYTIVDPDLWKLLLVQRPKDIKLELTDAQGNATPALVRFRDIVHDLFLVDSAVDASVGVDRRAKYKLLSDKKGRGFLFTSTEPDFLRKTLVNPNVVVVPSDKKGLLRELLKSVAELRSGNTSMQNIVVPLAQEAKRLKILPPNLLSPKEMSWVFA